MAKHAAQNQNKRQFSDQNHELTIKTKRMKNEPEQTTSSQLPRQDSTSSEDTIIYNSEPVPVESSRPQRQNSSYSTHMEKSDDTSTEDDIGNDPEEDNFLDKARKEGKSEAEIAVLKFNYLISQAMKNAQLIQQEQMRTGHPSISDNEKRKMMRSLYEAQPIVKSILTKK
ncbi:hypothetical protein [Endozoicomonas elysicola]|nr:hypothetical protein [Endozoicomonas elysicola]